MKLVNKMTTCAICLDGTKVPRSCSVCSCTLHQRCLQQLHDSTAFGMAPRCPLCRTALALRHPMMTRSRTLKAEADRVTMSIKAFENSRGDVDEQYGHLEDIFHLFYEYPRLMVSSAKCRNAVRERLLVLRALWPRASYHYQRLVGVEIPPATDSEGRSSVFFSTM